MNVYTALVIIVVFVVGAFIGEVHGFNYAKKLAEELILSQLRFIDLVHSSLSLAYPKGDAAIRETVKELMPAFELLLEYPAVAAQLKEAKKK